MLSSDEIILNILLDAKKKGNKLLKHFHIGYPNKQISQESNSIFIASVSSENNLDGFEFQTFTDLVEILVVTKKRDYQEAKKVIKTTIIEICNLILENQLLFPNKPVFRNVNPEFNRDYVLTRGHIMVQVNTDSFEFINDDNTFEDVCAILDAEIEIK